MFQIEKRPGETCKKITNLCRHEYQAIAAADFVRSSEYDDRENEAIFYVPNDTETVTKFHRLVASSREAQ